MNSDLKNFHENIRQRYSNVLKHVRDRNIHPSIPFFDIDKSPLKVNYHLFFNWCQNEMEEPIYRLSFPLIVIVDNPSINAFADSKPHYQMVAIYRGLFEKFDMLLANKASIFDEERFLNYNKFFNQLGIDPTFLMHSQVMLFCFGHELGHLMQKRGDYVYISESDNGDSKDRLVDHVKRVRR